MRDLKLNPNQSPFKLTILPSQTPQPSVPQPKASPTQRPDRLVEGQPRILGVLPDTNPVLRQKSEPYVFGSSIDPITLGQTLIMTMRAYKGLGLSAIQVGIPLRVFCVGWQSQTQVFFNPQLVQKNEKIVKDKEGCLSSPLLFLPIERPSRVMIRWQNERAQWCEETYDGLTARAIYHEYDHLDGILFTEHVGAVTLKMARDKQMKLLKKITRHEKRQK